MDKSPDAFRTISEVAETLETPAHVLRFWESRFPQIRPVKRAGGRRYYRPADVALLSGIRHLLHDEGMTIRGVQKILREQGVRHVAALAMGGVVLDEAEDEDFLGAAVAGEPESAEIVELAPPQARTPRPIEEPAGEVLHLYRPLAEAEPFPEAPEEVPEAGHVWVEDEPELNLDAPPTPEPGPFTPHAQPRRIVPPARQAPAEPPIGSMFDDIFAAPQPAPTEPAPAPTEATEMPLMLSGLTQRIRALPRPLSPEALLELMELHSRLGLLHAQVAEALRGRR